MNIFIQCLTYFRMIAGPIIFLLILIPQYYGSALLILLVASSSDYWDGYLARKYSLTSLLGAVLDPIADKILITFVLIALALALDSIFIAFLGSVILAREFWVSALRELNAINKNLDATKVTFMAKIKTTAQFIAISGYVLALYFNLAILLFVSNFILLVAVLVTLITGIEYTTNTLKVTLRED